MRITHSFIFLVLMLFVMDYAFAQDSDGVDSLTTPTWLIAYGTIGVGLATVAAISFNTYKQSQHLSQMKKENEIKLFLNITQKLNDEKNVDARRTIYDAYLDVQEQKIKGEQFLSDDTIRKAAQLTRSAYHEIAFMIEKKYFSDELFLNMYSGSIAKSWIALKQSICQERILRKETTKKDTHKTEGIFLIKFETLAEKAIKKREDAGLSNEITRLG